MGIVVPKLSRAATVGRAPAYWGLLLDAGSMLLQVTRQVAETYASIGRRYSLYASRGSRSWISLRCLAFSATFVKALAFLTLVAL